MHRGIYRKYQHETTSCSTHADEDGPGAEAADFLTGFLTGFLTVFAADFAPRLVPRLVPRFVAVAVPDFAAGFAAGFAPRLVPRFVADFAAGLAPDFVPDFAAGFAAGFAVGIAAKFAAAFTIGFKAGFVFVTSMLPPYPVAARIAQRSSLIPRIGCVSAQQVRSSPRAPGPSPCPVGWTIVLRYCSISCTRDRPAVGNPSRKWLGFRDRSRSTLERTT